MAEEVKHDEYGEVLNHKGQRLNALGQELPDPRPMAPPLGYIEQPPLHELIRQMIRSEQLQREAAEAGAETFEEADDFDVDDDDYDPTSPWENEFDPPPPVADPGEGQSPSETPSSEPEATPPSPTPEKS